VARTLPTKPVIVIEVEQLFGTSFVPELSGASRSIHPAVFTADGLCDTEYVLQVSASAVLCGEYTGLRTAADTNIAVTENVRYLHAVAGAMSHIKQTLQSADAGSNPGLCIRTTVAAKLAASRTVRWMVYSMITCARLSEHQLVTSGDSCNAVQDAASVERTAANPDDC
jgi:hypothetical protein